MPSDTGMGKECCRSPARSLYPVQRLACQKILRMFWEAVEKEIKNPKTFLKALGQMDPKGFEPSVSAMRTQRFPS